MGSTKHPSHEFDQDYLADLEAEAAFWERSPEEIHADPTRKVTEDSEDSDAFLDLASPEDRPLLALLAVRNREVWPHLPEEKRDHFVKYEVLQRLASDGADAWKNDGVVRYVERLWGKVDTASSFDEAKKAFERLTRVLADAFEIRWGKRAEQDLIPLVEAYEQAQEFVQGLATKKYPKADDYKAKLKAKFPLATDAELAELAMALHTPHTSRRPRREVILEIVAGPFSLSGTYAREVLPVATKERNLKRRIEAGQKRYRDWQARQESA